MGAPQTGNRTFCVFEDVLSSLSTVNCFKKITGFHLAITPYVIWICIGAVTGCIQNQLPVNNTASHLDIILFDNSPFKKHCHDSCRMGRCGSRSCGTAVFISRNRTRDKIARSCNVGLNRSNSCVASAGFCQDVVIQLIIGSYSQWAYCVSRGSNSYVWIRVYKVCFVCYQIS